MLIDTHCHLDFEDFDRDRDDVLDRAVKTGVGRIINVGSSVLGSLRAVELADKYDMVYASVGVHPHDAGQVTDKVIGDLRELAKNDKVVAIGEVGLDYYRNLAPKDKQIEAFKKFISLSLELDLPLIIHSREADADTVATLNEIRNTNDERRIRGVIHCFSGDETFLQACLNLGLYVSFTCNLTFRNAKALRETAKNVPIEKLLLETDAPYLSPEGFRGKRNEPAFLSYLVDEWVKLTGLSKADIERITTHNANKLFGLRLKDESAKIAYEIRDSLYLNITNTCTNSCDFCVRAQTAFVKGHNLRLEREPSAEDLIEAIGDPSRYKEIVFCGYGEPTARLDVVKMVAKWVKSKRSEVRIVTNGHGDLINKRPIAKELAGFVDKVSVSLNTDKKDMYDRICKPEFGSQSYDAVKKFIKDCVENKIKTEVTCLDLEGVDLNECENIAKSLGASFRARTYGVTG